MTISTQSNLSYSCAENLEDVKKAWSLVHDRYLEIGLINKNNEGVHTTKYAIGPHSCVVLGRDNFNINCTMTMFYDNPKGLALDTIYSKNLEYLRNNGGRLLEVGMLAEHKNSTCRGIDNLMNMMHWAIYFGLHNDITDIVIGVHPKHVAFYIRYYGFEEFASRKNYPLVLDNPVVILRLVLKELFSKVKIPRGIKHAHKNPLPLKSFINRFSFNPSQLNNSLLTIMNSK